MRIQLKPLSKADFKAWFDDQTVSYANDKIRAKQWGPEGALERARADTARLLPDGVDTPDHFVRHIVDTESSQQVGSLWWCVSERFGRRIAFIFDIQVDEAHRRRGYAKSAIRRLEEVVRDQQIEAISLHVFAFNEGAQALYEALGFATTSVSMTFELGDVPETPE